MESFFGRNLTFILPGILLLVLVLLFSGAALLNVLIVLCSVFLICLVLIQRGRGGGLAGAFGGMGGSSAFGTKAGDVFTWTTVVTAIVWFLLAMKLVWVTNRTGLTVQFDRPGSSRTAPADTSIPAPKTTTNTSAPAGTDKDKAAALPAALEDTTPSTPASTPAPAPSTPPAKAP